MDLHEVCDRLEIEAVLHRFADGLDRCDWPLYRSVFTDEIDLDYSSYRAGSVGRWRADDWVARARPLFHGLTATQHSLSNLQVSFDGADRARAVVHVRADHVLQVDGHDLVHTLGGYYDDVLVRATAGWSITAKKLVVRWREGDPGIMEIAAERGRAAAPDFVPVRT